MPYMPEVTPEPGMEHEIHTPIPLERSLSLFMAAMVEEIPGLGGPEAERGEDTQRFIGDIGLRRFLQLRC